MVFHFRPQSWIVFFFPEKKLEVQGFKNWRAQNFGWNSDSLHLIAWLFWNFGSVPKVCFLYIPHLCKGKGPFSWRFLRFLRQLQTAYPVIKKWLNLHPRTGKLNWQSGTFYGTFTSLIHLYLFFLPLPSKMAAVVYGQLPRTMVGVQSHGVMLIHATVNWMSLPPRRRRTSVEPFFFCQANLTYPGVKGDDAKNTSLYKGYI